jgi:hypothetical protein
MNINYELISIFDSAQKEQIKKQYAINVFELMNEAKSVMSCAMESGLSLTVLHLEELFRAACMVSDKL